MENLPDGSDRLSFTVKTEQEFREALPAIDAVGLVIDATRLPGETEKQRRLRVAPLMREVLGRYSQGGRLTRELHIIADKQPGAPDLRRARLHQLKANGKPGRRLGRVVSPTAENCAAAVRRMGDPSGGASLIERWEKEER